MSSVSLSYSSDFLTIAVTNTHLGSGDFVAVYPHGPKPSDPSEISLRIGWAYLNNAQWEPTSPVATATITRIRRPDTGGAFDVYLWDQNDATYTPLASQLSVAVPDREPWPPLKPIRDLSVLELTSSNKFGPGVSIVNGQPNPAGPRSGRVIICTTNQQFADALTGADGVGYEFGDDIVLSAGVTYTPFGASQFPIVRIPSITGGTPLMPDGSPSYVRIMSSAWDSLPDNGDRIQASDLPNMPTLQGNSTDDVIQVGQSPAVPVHHIRFEGIHVRPGNPVVGFCQLFDCGRNSVASAVRPHHIILDRVYLNGNPNGQLTRASVRGVYRCWSWAGFIGCTFDNFSGPGAETSAIHVSFTEVMHVKNCYIAATGEGILFGGEAQTWGGYGDDSASDITIERTLFDRKPWWLWDMNPYNNDGTIQAVFSGGNTAVTGTGTHWYNGAVTLNHAFYVPGNPPVRILGYNGDPDTTLLIEGNYGPFPAGTAYGIIMPFSNNADPTGGAGFDSPIQSPGVTVTVTGNNTVTRSSGTWPASVYVGAYFVRLDTVRPGHRYRISAMTLTTLTVEGSPANVTNAVDWMIGPWDGSDDRGIQKDLIDFKLGVRCWVHDCVFRNYGPSGGQKFPFKIAAQNNGDNRPVIEHTVENNVFIRCGTVIGMADNIVTAGPTLFQNNLAVDVWDGDLQSGDGTIWAYGSQQRGFRFLHNTIIPRYDVHTDVSYGQMFDGSSNNAAIPAIYGDNIFPFGAHGLTNAWGAGSDDGMLAALGVPQTNLFRNVFTGFGANSLVTTGGQYRGGTLDGSRYGNAAVLDPTTIFENVTNDETGDYRLKPIYTTDAAACSVSGAVVTISSGTFPTTIQKGVPFRMQGDTVDKATSVSSRDSATQVTLAQAYTGSTTGTGLFTFQGTASDGTDPGVADPVGLMTMALQVVAGQAETSGGGGGGGGGGGSSRPGATHRPAVTHRPPVTRRPVIV